MKRPEKIRLRLAAASFAAALALMPFAPSAGLDGVFAGLEVGLPWLAVLLAVPSVASRIRRVGWRVVAVLALLVAGFYAGLCVAFFSSSMDFMVSRDLCTVIRSKKGDVVVHHYRLGYLEEDEFSELAVRWWPFETRFWRGKEWPTSFSEEGVRFDGHVLRFPSREERIRDPMTPILLDGEPAEVTLVRDRRGT